MIVLDLSVHQSGSHPLLFNHILWAGINIVPRELFCNKLWMLSTDLLWWFGPV